MKFSIITPVKNNSKYILQNILSVKNQSFKNFEHIIIDGKSNDQTIPIIKKNSHSKLRLISERDRGIYDAMNKGIKIAKGDIICILNSDDYFYKNALKIINKYFTIYKNIDFIFGTVFKHKLMHGYYPKKIFWTFGFYTTHSVGFFIKKKSHSKVGLYNLKYKYSSDYDFFYRMIVKKKLNGMATKKNEIIGFFRPGGYSSKVKYIDWLNENTQIRMNNGQNFIIVKFIHILRFLKRAFIILKQR